LPADEHDTEFTTADPPEFVAVGTASSGGPHETDGVSTATAGRLTVEAANAATTRTEKTI